MLVTKNDFQDIFFFIFACGTNLAFEPFTLKNLEETFLYMTKKSISQQKNSSSTSIATV